MAAVRFLVTGRVDAFLKPLKTLPLDPSLEERYNGNLAISLQERFSKGRHLVAFQPAENEDIDRCLKRAVTAQLIEKALERLGKADPNKPELALEKRQYADNMYSILQINPAIVTTKYGIDLKYTNVFTLLPREWLDDTVINFFLYLIVDRSERNQKSAIPDPRILRVWSHSTFFYSHLTKRGFPAVERWTKKLRLGGQKGIFAFDLVLVPIHLGSHWAMGVINVKRKRIEYYDSLGELEKTTFFKKMREYLPLEWENSKKEDEQGIDLTEWKYYTLGNCPQQSNGYDCGEFACRFAEYVSRDAAFDFTTVDMVYFRRRHVLEILRGLD